MALPRTLRTDFFAAHIALYQERCADLSRTVGTHPDMLRTDHFPTQFTLADMVNTDQVPADVATKCTFRTHLLSAKCAGMSLRLTNMLVAARASDETVKTDRFMAKITFEQVNLTQKLTILAKTPQ